MKRFTLFFGLLLFTAMTFAQTPQAFNYQAVIRDADGNLLENQAVGIKISLLQGSATGQEVYAETHAVTSNQFGQVDLKIGTGAVQTGQFTANPWKSGNFYLKLAVDITGGFNYQVMGTAQMLSVPYALYAEEGSGWEKTENGIAYLNGNVGIGTSTPTSQLEIRGNNPKISFGYGANSNIPYLTTDPSNHFAFGNVGSGEWMRITNSGNVGIGTNNPSNAKLAVMGNVGIATSDPRNSRLYILASSNFNDVLSFGRSGYTSEYTFGVTMANGTNHLVLRSNYVDPIMVWKEVSGYVGIGTTNPTYPLTVNGTIRSKKVIVDTGWSDFVFEDDYSLMPLHQLDKFIEDNKHLPEIPSAKEVEENGISLGEMDAKLLQKIEELTLYTIEQQKMIDELVKQNDNQQQLIEEQSKQLKKLEKHRSR